MSLRVILTEIQNQFIPDLLNEILDYLDFEIAELFPFYHRPKHVLLYDIVRSGFNLEQKVKKWKTTFNRLSWKDNQYVEVQSPFFNCQCFESIITFPKSPNQWARCIREQENAYHPKMVTLMRYTDFVVILTFIFTLFAVIRYSLAKKFSWLRSKTLQIILRITLGGFLIINLLRVIYFSTQFYNEDNFILGIERIMKPYVNHHNKLLSKYKQNKDEHHS